MSVWGGHTAFAPAAEILLGIDFPGVARAPCVPILWGLCVVDRL